MTSAVANRYARAFADVVMSPDSGLAPEDAIAQLRSIEALLAESSDLLHALSSPAVRKSSKHAVARQLGGELGLSRMVLNLLLILIAHHRIGILSNIREAFENEMNERLGFVRADVFSAQALDPAQTAEIEAALTQVSGKQVRARFDVDPSLIGGVLARIGSTVYDGSIRGQLENMRRQIALSTAAGL